MKFKFLSLFLTLGLLALGAGVKAEEEGHPHHHGTEAGAVAEKAGKPGVGLPCNIPNTTVPELVKCFMCTALSAGLTKIPGYVPQQLVDGCAGPCKTDSSDPALKSVENCAATLYSFYNDTTNQTKFSKAYAVVKPIISALSGGNFLSANICNSGCITKPTNICKNYSVVRQACGAICCNVGGSVTNCLKQATETCDTYKGTVSPPSKDEKEENEKGEPLLGTW